MATSQQVESNRDYSRTLTIAVGQSESESINISGSNLTGLIIGSNITGDYIHFLVRDSINGTYEPVKTSTAKTNLIDPVLFNVGLNIDGGGNYSFKPEDLASWQFLKIKTVTDIAGGEAAVNQTGSDVTIKLVLRPIN